MADFDITMNNVENTTATQLGDPLQAVANWISGINSSIFPILLQRSHAPMATDDFLGPINETAFINILSHCPRIPLPVTLKPRVDRERIWTPGHARQRSEEEEDHAELLNDAFTGAFQGDAVELFCQMLPRYAEAYDPSTYYGRIIAWYGPSGAGKSKGIDTLQKIFPTFTVCFRNSMDPSKGWPPGDLPIVRYFDQRSQSTAVAEESVAAFLGAYLEIAALELSKYADTTDASHLASCVHQTWNYEHKRGVAYEVTRRGILFQAVADCASELLKAHSTQPVNSTLTEPSARYAQLWQTYCELPAQELMRMMKSTSFCFFALDECTEIPGVPSIAIHRILKAGNAHNKLWFILVGTNATVHTLVPTSLGVAPSQRFRQLQCLPPWCYFDYSQLAPADPSTPAGALEIDYLRKVGRPLFATYRTASAAYLTATTKLFSPRPAFDATSCIHVLTAFSHRILLELGNTPTAHQVAAESVNFNLRYPIQIDGGIVRTICPSEPLLSLISSDVLIDGDNFSTSLKTLVEEVKKATIDRGQEGELYTRLLIIRARDFALHKKINADGLFKVDGHSNFSHKSFAVRTISLEEHLEALVHLDRLGPTDQAAIRAFSRPYHVNITHIIQLLEPISALPQTYLYQLFIKGAAVQCCHSQPVIDGFFVAYSGELDKPFDMGLFIIVPWQSKAKVSAAPLASLVAAVTGPMQIDGSGQRCKPAELVLVLDLNAKAAFRATTSATGDAHLQATYRPGVPPPASNKTTPQSAKAPKPWAGYALPGELNVQPSAWCLNVRGHTVESYPCLGPTSTETAPPGFNDLFAEVGYVGNATANQITRLVADQTLAVLQPLGSFVL
ncbi:hypothetical protein C8R43DRAFT_955927 [Mycena crocata]|nr:hypothetical protein C8R43DRAFT_955927 [Mycena crocata]